MLERLHLDTKSRSSESNLNFLFECQVCEQFGVVWDTDPAVHPEQTSSGSSVEDTVYYIYHYISKLIHVWV